MPECPFDSCELADDALMGLWFCWRCRRYYWLDNNGELRIVDRFGDLPGAVTPSADYL